MTNIGRQITEEAYRYESAYGVRPEFIFLGSKQMRELDELVAEMERFGFIEKANDLPKRATYEGKEIFRVDAENHFSFGVRQPSPCG